MTVRRESGAHPKTHTMDNDVMDSYYLKCLICHLLVDPSGPAVAELRSDSDRTHMWIPFVEDLRTSAARLMHPVCFANSVGVEALVAVVHRRDAAERGR
jgi:hypothetical protein